MHHDKIIEAFNHLGHVIDNFIATNLAERTDRFPYLTEAVALSHKQNSWFTVGFIESTLKGIRQWLYNDKLSEFCKQNNVFPTHSPKNIGLIMAGNIPLVGFHDFLCVMLSGHNAIVKLSSKDSTLLPALAKYLIDFYPEISSRVSFVDDTDSSLEAVIATGSNNTKRYFKYRYKSIGAILRGHRNSIAVLTGNETEEEFRQLSDDICLYFGMGCRSVAKVFVPDISIIYKIGFYLDRYKWFINHNEWNDNLRFQRALLMTRKQRFFDCNNMLFVQSTDLSSPLSVVYYDLYHNIDSLKVTLHDIESEIQCVVGNPLTDSRFIPFGKAQLPDIDQFADDVNTLEFLKKLGKNSLL